MMYKTKRERLNMRAAELLAERSTHENTWRDLGEYILPYRIRFLTSDKDRGDKRENLIIDGTGTHSATVLEAGFTSGVTSPARKWFRLTTPNAKLAEIASVKEYLHDVETIMVDTLLKSNVYSILPTAYGDMGTFANAAIMVEEDFKTVINATSFPIGSYCIAVNSKGRVNEFYHESAYTLRQLLEKFAMDESGQIDWSVIPENLKRAWENNHKGQKVDVCHLIEPNPEYNERKLEAKYKKFASTWWVKGDCKDDKFLRESGYDYFPVLSPRWKTSGNDAYGTDCPGRRALGDIMQLQYTEKLSLQAIELNVRPPMKAPTWLEGKHSSQIPGGVTFVDEQHGKYERLYEINPRVTEVEAKNESVRRRIQRFYFEDVFLRILSDDRKERASAAEIVEGKEEKFLILGPTLQQVDKDLLDPLIEILFDMLERQGKLPKAPQEVQGLDLKIEYISVMAQAQKLVGLSAMERMRNEVGMVAQMIPSALDKFDADQYLDEIADSLGTSPRIIRSDDKVDEIRSAQAKAQQAQAMAQMIPQAAAAAKDLSQASLDGDNALTELMNRGNAGAMVEGI